MHLVFDCFVFLLRAVNFKSTACVPWESFRLLAESLGLTLTST